MTDAALTLLGVGPTIIVWTLMSVGILVMVIFAIRVFAIFLWYTLREGVDGAIAEVTRRFLR